MPNWEGVLLQTVSHAFERLPTCAVKSSEVTHVAWEVACQKRASYLPACVGGYLSHMIQVQ